MDIFQLFSRDKSKDKVPVDDKGLIAIKEAISAEMRELETTTININAHIKVLIDELFGEIDSSGEKKVITLRRANEEERNDERFRYYEELILAALKKIKENEKRVHKKTTAEKQLLQGIVHAGIDFKRRWRDISGKFDSYLHPEQIVDELFDELGRKFSEETRQEQLILKLIARDTQLTSTALRRLKEEMSDVEAMQRKLSQLRGPEAAEAKAVLSQLREIKTMYGEELQYDSTLAALCSQFMQLIADQQHQYGRFTLTSGGTYRWVSSIVDFADGMLNDREVETSGKKFTTKSIITKKLDILRQILQHLDRKLRTIQNLYVTTGRTDEELKEIIEKKEPKNEEETPVKKAGQIHLIIPDIHNISAGDAEYKDGLSAEISKLTRDTNSDSSRRLVDSISNQIYKCLTTRLTRADIAAATKILNTVTENATKELKRLQSSVSALKRSKRQIPENISKQIRKQTAIYRYYSHLKSQLAYILKYWGSLSQIIKFLSSRTKHDLHTFFMESTHIKKFTELKELLAFIWFFVHNFDEIRKMSEKSTLVADPMEQLIDYYTFFTAKDIFPPLDSAGNISSKVIVDNVKDKDTRKKIDRKILIHPAE